MLKKLIAVAVLAVSFVLSQTALADSSICRESLQKMVESLKLDDAQKEKIKPILEQLKTTMQGSWSQMKDLRTQIDQQANSATMDQNAVNGLIDQKVKLIGEMMKAKFAAKNQISTILNEQQKTELQDKMKKMEEKMAEKYKDCHDDD
ncbi:MAG: Spy/CpxP family protein refolding chaperone [Tatlockia sp.]|nr:Spy/CpxP family protein refolding chaperone [Tatlockia sp.]